MRRWIVAAGLAVSVAGFGAVLLAEEKAGSSGPTTAPATAPADVGNTKCPIMNKNLNGPGRTVTYEGKIYHLCCDRCVRAFQQDPARYVAILEKNPDKYGVTK